MLEHSSSSLSLHPPTRFFSFFFFNDPPTTEIYTLSLHDALPISHRRLGRPDTGELRAALHPAQANHDAQYVDRGRARSEEHTSELQSPCNLVCRRLLEKKNSERAHVPTLVSPANPTPPSSSPTRT